MAVAPWVGQQLAKLNKLTSSLQNALGGGKFQSKAAIEERKRKGETLRNMLGQSEQSETQVKMSEALEKVANEHGKDITVTAVALAYALQKSPYVFPVSL